MTPASSPAVSLSGRMHAIKCVKKRRYAAQQIKVQIFTGTIVCQLKKKTQTKHTKNSENEENCDDGTQRFRKSLTR